MPCLQTPAWCMVSYCYCCLTSSDVCGGSAVLRHCTKNFFPYLGSTSHETVLSILFYLSRESVCLPHAKHGSARTKSPTKGVVALSIHCWVIAFFLTFTPSIASNSMKSSRSNMYLHSVFSAV